MEKLRPENTVTREIRVRDKNTTEPPPIQWEELPRPRRCEELLTERRAQLENVAKYLLEHETMEREAFLSVMEGHKELPQTPEA